MSFRHSDTRHTLGSIFYKKNWRLLCLSFNVHIQQFAHNSLSFFVSTRKRKIYSIGVHERMRYAQTITMKCEIYGRNWYLKSTIGITFGPRHNSTDISKFYCSFLLFFYRLIPWLLLFNWMKQIIEFKHTFWSIFPVVISTAGKLI